MGLRKQYTLRRKGGIPKNFNSRLGRSTHVVYAHDVESPLARVWQLPQVVAYYLRHFAPLVAIHGSFRGLHFQRCSSFNLHKTKHIIFPPN
jgi:hypothetical protein